MIEGLMIVGLRARDRSPIADRINGERLVLLGWPCAILMQVAHPLVAAGVARHSTFRNSVVAPVQRLHHTVRAMLGLTFGSADERTRVIGTIRDIHTRVNGTLAEPVGRYPAGTRYSAEDPALVLWVHATLIHTSVNVYAALIDGLSSADRDEYCRAGAAVAVALGADEAAVPRDWAAMTTYVESVVRSGDLAVGTDARALARALLYGAVVRATGPVAWAQRALTAAWLPSTLRAEYAIGWNARREQRVRRLMRALRHTRRWTPALVARWPASRPARGRQGQP